MGKNNSFELSCNVYMVLSSVTFVLILNLHGP